LVGETNLFGVLMDKYTPMVLSVFRDLDRSADEKEDLIQDVFISAYESLSMFRGEAQFSTWLYQIARNRKTKVVSDSSKSLSIDDHSQFDHLELSPLEKLKAFGSHLGSDAAMIRSELTQKIQSLVSHLPAKYKKPIVLYYFENLSYKEISETLNLKMNTLKSYIFRGKEILREWMHEKSDI
jgi:RNA polymerase sigma-70 factor (ECF subfamily)